MDITKILLQKLIEIDARGDSEALFEVQIVDVLRWQSVEVGHSDEWIRIIWHGGCKRAIILPGRVPGSGGI